MRGGNHDVLIVLAFGRPSQAWGHEGTELIRGGFQTVWRIRDGVIGYAKGFLECTSGRPTPQLTVAAGTSNWGPHVTYWHGRAWAEMVNQANDWLRPIDTSRRVTVLGANDIELSWNGPRPSRRWVSGYDSAARWPYLDFGDAGSCPPYGSCAGAWRMEDLWWVAWGSHSAWPLPEIYTNSGSQARQWYELSLYSYRRHGRPMTVAGVLSQRRACRQSTTDPCTGINNTPSRAWSQLWALLNRDRRTAQTIRWATDIGYDR